MNCTTAKPVYPVLYRGRDRRAIKDVDSIRHRSTDAGKTADPPLPISNRTVHTVRQILYKSTGLLKSILVLSLILLPNPRPSTERDMARDISLLQHAECEYQGIRTSFDELTRAYILATYAGGQLLRWQAQPSPYNPETETMVTAVFTATGQKSPAPSSEIAQIRSQSLHGAGITWRYSTLATTRVIPHGALALDALAVFRETVDDFVDRMVYTSSELRLHAEASPNAPLLGQVNPGTVLLVEEQLGIWLRVRDPSTTDAGWLKRNKVEFIRKADASGY